MPRKVDPHWGEDGYGPEDDDHQPWRPVELGDAELADLAGMLGIDPASRNGEHLRSVIIDIGNTYRRWHKRGAGAFDRAHARTALEELLAADRIDHAAITVLNERALQCVYDSLLSMNPAPIGLDDSITRALMENRIDEGTLRQAVQDAVIRLKETHGPERDGGLAWAVAELCKVYEQATGRRTTHSNKANDLGYRQEPQSEAGRFVFRCFRIIDAKIRPHLLSHALRLFVESARRRSP